MLRRRSRGNVLVFVFFGLSLLNSTFRVFGKRILCTVLGERLGADGHVKEPETLQEIFDRCEKERRELELVSWTIHGVVRGRDNSPRVDHR
jgi:hypothetical protein